MERNILLTVALSALVLFSYQVIFPAPKQVNLPNNATHNVSEINNSPATTSSNNITQSTNAVEKTVNFKLETTNAEFSYTNVGGSLHNVDFTGNNPFPVTDVLSIGGLENAGYSGQKSDDRSVSFTYNDGNWQITKTYVIADKNLIKVRMEIKNVSKISILNSLRFTAFEIDDSRMDINEINNHGRYKNWNAREIALYEYSIYSNNRIFRKGNAAKFNDKNNKIESGIVNWIGFRDHYHAFIVKPDFDTKGYQIKTDSDQQLNISINPQEKNVAPGESVTYNFDIYAGPQNPPLMKKYGEGFEKIVAFSNFPIVEWIAQAIYHIIPFLHHIFKSWGVAIILVSMMLYLITYPLTMQNMMSMRKMQAVQPKIKALQEKYKNDPQKLNAEMVEIYRREKINPLGGCLPMLIQMPFFMALYQILWRAQYLQGQKFLWINDLSQPDRLIILPFYLPFLGNEINILPILTGGIMFLQQKISNKNMVVTDEQQAMQQKMMMYFLPVMMTAMFYKFASSWAIYFLVYYILSTVTQWKIAQASGSK